VKSNYIVLIFMFFFAVPVSRAAMYYMLETMMVYHGFQIAAATHKK
jgi:hypothetical protein